MAIEGLEARAVETAMQLFVTNGIKSVSMDDISKHMGISKRTLYEMFSSKDDLLVRCLEAHRVKKYETMKRELTPDRSFAEVLIYVVGDFISESSRVNPLFYQDLSLANLRGASDLCREHEADDRRNFVELLKRGQNDGVIRPDVNPDFICDAVYAKNGSSSANLISNGRWHVADILMGLVIPFFRGLATAKGVEEIDRCLERYKQIQADLVR